MYNPLRSKRNRAGMEEGQTEGEREIHRWQWQKGDVNRHDLGDSCMASGQTKKASVATAWEADG